MGMAQLKLSFAVMAAAASADGFSMPPASFSALRSPATRRSAAGLTLPRTGATAMPVRRGGRGIKMMGVGAVLDKGVIDFALYVLEILLMKGLVFQIFTLIFMAVVLTSSLVASLYTVSLLRAYAMRLAMRSRSQGQTPEQQAISIRQQALSTQLRQTVYGLRTTLKRVQSKTGLNIALAVIAIITFLGILVKFSVDGVVKNNGLIFETGHTVIISDTCSQQVVSLVSSLAAAAREKNPLPEIQHGTTLVLTSDDKAEALERMRVGIQPAKLVARTGDVLRMDDLHSKASISTARHVLMLCSAARDAMENDEPSEELLRDIRTKTALVSQFRKEAKEADDGVAAVVSLPGSEAWTEFEDGFSVYEDQEFVGEILTECSQPQGNGLARVYNQLLLTAGGNHMMYSEEPLSRSAPFLVGKTYGDSKFHFPRAIVCGIIDGDGRVRMLPPRDWLLSKEDRIVALARDRNDLVPKRIIKPPRLNVDQKQVKRAVTAAASADVVSAAEQGGGAGSRIVILNWNERGERTLGEVRAKSAPGTKISVLTDKTSAELGFSHADPLPRAGAHVKFWKGDTMDGEHLKTAGVIDSDCIVIFSDTDAVSNVDHHSDAAVFAHVTQLSALSWPDDAPRPRIVATVYSQEAYGQIAALCNRAGFQHDLILADAIESGSLVQILMRPKLEAVFHDMLTKEAEMQLKPVSDLLPGCGGFSGTLRQLRSSSDAVEQSRCH